MVAAALAAGGKVNDFEPGKALLMEAKKAGVRIYPTNEAFAQALKTEEIGIGIMWKARAVQWQNAGISVEIGRARAKACRCTSRASSIPKNAPNKDGGYAYIDAMLERAAQENFADRHGLQPDRHQRRRCRPTCRSASASPPRSRSASSISTTPTSPRTTPR